MTSSRSNIVCALVIALALHALLAGALALYLSHAPAPDELAELDLTSVELSFAETVEETAAAVASAPSRPIDAAPPTPRCAPVSDAPTPPRCALASDAPTPPRCAPVSDAPTPPRCAPVSVAPTPPRCAPVSGARQPRQTDPKLPSPTDPVELMPPAAPRQARVDAPPKPRLAIKPDYPRESRLRGEHGDVALELDVAADGSVSGVRIIRSPGYPLLDEAAVKAARAARFTPARSGDKPVASTVRLTLNFKLK